MSIFGWFDRVEESLGRIESKLDTLLRKENKEMADLQNLIDAEAALTAAIEAGATQQQEQFAAVNQAIANLTAAVQANAGDIPQEVIDAVTAATAEVTRLTEASQTQEEAVQAEDPGAPQA